MFELILTLVAASVGQHVSALNKLENRAESLLIASGSVVLLEHSPIFRPKFMTQPPPIRGGFQESVPHSNGGPRRAVQDDLDWRLPPPR